MTPEEVNAFREDLDKVKEKHLKNLRPEDRKMVLATLVKGAHVADYPYYRRAIGLLECGQDRKLPDGSVLRYEAP